MANAQAVPTQKINMKYGAISQTLSSVPEPAMVALLAVGLLGMVVARRRLNHK